MAWSVIGQRDAQAPMRTPQPVRGACIGLVLALGASTAPRADEDPTGQLCVPRDQLGCNCDAAMAAGANGTRGPVVNDLVTPCFLGQPNRAKTTQTDPWANNAFAALNWPQSGAQSDAQPRARGTPDYETTPTQAAQSADYVTVWDTWPNAGALFRGDGAAPDPWDTAVPPLPAACRALDVAVEMAKYGAAQVPQGSPVRLLDDFINPDGDGLIDASGLPVRYEVLFNRQAYDYVRDNGLWDRGALDAYVEAKGGLEFPAGQWLVGPQGRGSIVLKAAWKILDVAQDNPANFHKSWAYVTPVIADGKVDRAACELRPVALVALHVTAKGDDFEDWIWSTFEHIAVAPTWAEIAAVDQNLTPPYDVGDTDRTDWLFYAPMDNECLSCAEVSPLNRGFPIRNDVISALPSRIVAAQPRGYYFPIPTPPAGTATPSPSLTPTPTGTEVVLDSYAAMERLMSEGFAGTAFRYYRLKGAQWKSPNGNRPHVPEILANTVLEAFSQSGSSCLSCHAAAGRTATRRDGQPYDYLFSLGQTGIGTTVATEVPTPP